MAASAVSPWAAGCREWLRLFWRRFAVTGGEVRCGEGQENRTRCASDHRDDDLTLGPAAFDIGEGLRGLVERVRPVDDGSEDIGIDELGDLVELRTGGAQ